MADTPFPLPRELRMTAILAGNGGIVYGPFSFKIFDVADVSVFVRQDGDDGFAVVNADVQKVGNLPFDFFTVALPANLDAADHFVVAGMRVGERAAAVRKGTQIDITALEKQLSQQVAQGQELRRDIDRSVKADFGGAPLVVDGNIADGDVLVKNGGRISKGPSIGTIITAGERAEDAAGEAEAFAAAAGVQAVLSAASAAAASASRAQAQILVDLATAGYAGFEPGTFYDLGRLADDITLFPGDLGRLADL